MIATKKREASEVKRTLENDGFILLSQVGVDVLEDLVTEMGNIITITQIKWNEKEKLFINSTVEVDFLTDYPVADYIAWACIQNADTGGESLLVDMRKVMKNFSKEEIKTLSQIKFRIGRKGKNDAVVPMILDEIFSYEKYYYQPYRLKNSKVTEKQSLLLNRFKSLLKSSEKITLSLKKGDGLIVNNNFMLHGRNKYTGKQRHLKRFLIESKDEYLPFPKSLIEIM